MGATIRSVRDLKTHAGSVGTGSHSKERHTLQFKIGCLELERSRRLQERGVAEQRIRTIDARVAEIDREIRAHNATLAGESYAAPSSRAASFAAESVRMEDEAPRPRKRLKY